MNDFDLRFPIGEFKTPTKYTNDLVKKWILDIKAFPNQLRELSQALSPADLNLTYRKGGWSIKQVVHHCADSNMNAYMRFKLALTEDVPEIRPYFEDRWAELIDSNEDDISFSLKLIDSLHHRWVMLLENMTEKECQRKYYHPEHKKEFELREAIANYSWHCLHHLEHVKLALRRKGE